MVSVLVPLAYLIVLFGSLALFSKYYRKRQLESKAPKTPWFPHHKPRDIYVSLLSLDPVPDKHVLIAALLQRACEDVRRIWSIRDSKAALQTLIQKGQIGDELWEKFVLAEKELEAEIVEVVGEANYWQEGYGQQIFALASEMVTHQKWKDIYRGIAKEREIAAARYSTPIPSTSSQVLTPLQHLTPSSLTLFPSNPLSPSPSASAATPSPLAPPETLPIAPPSPALTPTPTPAPVHVASTSTSSVSNAGKEEVERPPIPPIPTTPNKAEASGSGTTTPGGSAKKGSAKKGKKKPPVKGGK